MTEHGELVAEISIVEKMSTLDRLKHAKKRRTQQVKKFVSYEKHLDKESSKKRKNQANKGIKRLKTQRVHFVSSVMLLESAARNDINEVRQLLLRGVSPNAANEDGLTALHQCCIDDMEDMLQLLIEYGADVNARDSELWTPLHAAATCGHIHLCKYLIDHKAELLATNADGNMPYDICEDEATLDFIENEMAKQGVTQELIDTTRLSSEKKMLDDLKYLANNQGDIENRGKCGETPLHIAAANGYILVTEFLLEQNVAVDPVDDDKWQPIHAAACWGHLLILEMLVHHGADLEVRTKTGETPFDICEDIDLRQRILDLKDEMEHNKVTSSQSLSRRRSQNTRSASVRRTSMRDKSAISHREAKEEAQRMLEASTGVHRDAEDDDDDLHAQVRPEVTQPEVTQPENTAENPMHEAQPPASQKTVPPVSLQVTPASPTEPEHEASPPVSQEANVTVVKINADSSDGRQAVRDGHSNADSAPVSSSDVQISMRNQSADKTNEKKEKVTKSTGASSGGGKKVKKSHSEPLPSTVSQTESESKTGDKPVKAAAPVPSPRKSRMRDSESKSPIGEKHPMAASPPLTEGKTQAEAPSSSEQHQMPEGHADASFNDLPITFNQDSPLTGTLADLKKQRAKKLQDAMKLTDPKLYQPPDQNVADGVQKVNGEAMANSTSRNGVKKDRNELQAASLDPPKHRYKASTNDEIIGGDDNSNSCCVIL